MENFKIDTKEELLEKLLCPYNWPDGAEVQQFLRKANSLIKTRPTNSINNSVIIRQVMVTIDIGNKFHSCSTINSHLSLEMNNIVVLHHNMQCLKKKKCCP